jgi:hypothetical protein
MAIKENMSIPLNIFWATRTMEYSPLMRTTTREHNPRQKAIGIPIIKLITKTDPKRRRTIVSSLFLPSLQPTSATIG